MTTLHDFPSLFKHTAIRLLDNELELWLELGVQIMLYDCQQKLNLLKAKLRTGFWTELAVYAATSSEMIILGIPFAAAASAINCEWHALSRL